MHWSTVEGENRARLRERIARSGLAVALIATIGAGVIGAGVVRAQGTSLSTSAVTPADAVFYAEVSLDTTRPELLEFDAILTRLGSEESLVETIESTATDPTSDVDLTGAEVAIVVLPSALESGADLSDDFLESATSGEIPDDLESTGAATGDEGVVVVIRSDDTAGLEASARESAGADVETVTYQGVEIVTDIDADSSVSSFAAVDEFMFAGSSAGELEEFIDLAQGTGDSLGDLEQFEMTSSLLPAERVAFAFTNGPAIMDAVEESMGDSSTTGLVQELLVNYSGYTGMIVTAEDAGIGFQTVIVPDDGSARAEAINDGAALDMATRMPIDTAVFASGYNLGDSLVLNSLGVALVAIISTSFQSSSDDEATPVPMSVDELYETAAGLFGFNLKTDFIDQFAGPYAFGVWGVEGEDPANLNVALVSDIDDVQTLDDTVSTITLLVQAAGQGQVNVVSRQLGGGSVNHVDIESDGSTISIDYGIVGDEFVLGVGDGAETVMSAPSESLADSSTYTDALSNLPADFQSVYYVDVAQLSEASAGMSEPPLGEEVVPEIFGSPADQTPVESFAAVTYVDEGYTFTSGILVVP